MANKSVAKNYFYNLAYQILIIILPLITTPYVSRVLGAENIGIYSYTISITTFFILFGSLGIALYGQRETAYIRKDVDKLSGTFFEIVILRVITMLISIIIFYFTFIFENNQYKTYYTILILELIANMIDISWFFQGLEEFKKIVLRNTLIKICSIICTFLFIKSKDDLVLYFIIYVLSTFIGNASLWSYLPKYIKKVNIRNLNVLKHVKPTIALFIPQIAAQVYTLLDKTMLGFLILDKSEVGFYEQSQKIIKVILTVITSAGSVMLPRIASIFSDGNKEKVQEYMKKSFNLVFILAFPLILGIISVAEKFVPIFFGDGYEEVIILMKVITPIILLIGLSNVSGTQYLLPTKRQREFTISLVAGAIINFIFNMLLIPKLGALGASIGTVIAELIVTTVQIYFTRKDFDYKKIIRNI